MATVLGTVLCSRYRLDERVGAGGMSTVYRAHDHTLERAVAIKLMHRDIAADSDQLERFRREARAVAQLSHPHIVGVIDAGEEDGQPFIVLEFVAGETLKQRIGRTGRLPVDEAVAYAIEIGRALGHAHANGIVHRDVKPQNVLIDEEGAAKVTDFGIARTLNEEGLTDVGRVLGTTDYVSPEQALGREVTGQSDLYSLGIVLYEMLTGEVPFLGDGPVAVAMMHVRDELPDVQARRRGVSTALAVVLDRATAKEVDQRYLDDSELIADLEDCLAIEAARHGQATGESTRVLRTLPEKSRRRLPLRVRHPAWLALAGLLAVVVGLVIALGAADRTEKGTGAGVARPPADLTAVSLAADSASDFDPPPGDEDEHAGETSFALDRDPTTFWSTETYQAGALQKPGVGISVDAAPGVAAKELRLQTDTPGFAAEIYASTDASAPEALEGWRKVAGAKEVSGRERFRLSGVGLARHYLVWITALPPGEQRAEISEIELFE